MTPRPVTALAPRQGSLERLPLLADHSAASAARIISARFAFVSGARASRLVILARWLVPTRMETLAFGHSQIGYAESRSVLRWTETALP